jgi:hypothetical protein
MELIRRPDGYVLPVSGQRITRCCIDNDAVVLLLINMLEIRISEPFTLASSGGDVRQKDRPADHGSGIGQRQPHAAQLLHASTHGDPIKARKRQITPIPCAR